MARVNAYLFFHGNCREAMTFYSECLGGELSVTTVGESPMANEAPPEAAESVMHASVSKAGDVMLMASDSWDADDVVVGSGFSLCLDCGSDEELNESFSRLSAGGQVVQPLKKQFWGDTFGMLNDKFGRTWMLTHTEGSPE